MYIYASARRGVKPALSTIFFVRGHPLLLIVNLRSIRRRRSGDSEPQSGSETSSFAFLKKKAKERNLRLCIMRLKRYK
jgi:hypothetical protein